MNQIVFTLNADSVLIDRLRGLEPEDVFVLVDENSREHCLNRFRETKFKDENIIAIESGEQHKSIETVIHIWSVLTAAGAKRNSVLVNIGGGLVTDMGGFAAACFKRGIRCINMPTTLLAQVDASVGGKTGINFGHLKNEIGTFSVPECVIIDNCFLRSLSQRQLLSGFAEMLKHGLLCGERELHHLFRVDFSNVDQPEFLQLIKDSVEVKKRIVEADPTEKGIRKALNFGHTVGHAVESVAIDKHMEVFHGDAVAYGMIAELYLSVKRLGFDAEIYQQVKALIRKLYPPYVQVASAEDLYELMLHDKKNDRKGVNFTLLRHPGEFVVDNYCNREEIAEALKELTD